MKLKDYWNKVPLSQRGNAKSRFNYIMNYIDTKLGASETKPETGDETEPSEIQTGDVNVTVTDVKTKQPVKGITVTIVNDDESVNLNAVTGSAGGCNIKNIPYGTYTIVAEADDYFASPETITVDADDIIYDITVEYLVEDLDDEVDDDF